MSAGVNVISHTRAPSKARPATRRVNAMGFIPFSCPLLSNRHVIGEELDSVAGDDDAVAEPTAGREAC